MLTDYTTYDEIRAVLGVSQIELPDATLALPLYDRLLTEELLSISSGLKSQYTTIAAILPESSRTALQQTYYEIVQLFSAYSTARYLLSSLQYFAANKITDGRAEEQRVADPYAATRDNVERVFGALRVRILAAYGGLGNSVTVRATRVYTTGVGLASDPVTA
jgi:hypothetical protein